MHTNSLPFTTLKVATPTEQLLVDGLRNKDQSAFEDLYHSYSGALLGIISVIVKQEEEAEDILQDTFVKISNSIHSYDANKSRLFTWMAMITRSKALDYIRSSPNRQSNKQESLENLLAEVNNKHYTHYNTDTIGIKALTAILTVQQKEIIDLIYFQGYTHAEVAEKLNIPVGTVKTRIRAAILTLRKHF